MPANKSIQARQQLRDPNTGRFRDEHRQSGMPTDESIRKYEQQPRPPLPPPTEVPLPPAKPRQASSRTIPVDGRPGSTLTVQDVPDQTHGMKRHTQFQSPTTSIRLETPISKNINLPKMEKVADDLETWRTRSNEKRGEYDAPIARMEASGTGLNRLTVRPVFGTPPRRPWQPWKWKAWQKARSESPWPRMDSTTYTISRKEQNGRYGQISAGETPTEGTRERPVQGRTQKKPGSRMLTPWKNMSGKHPS